jgi:ABC-type Zn uptake system ZnuABC Zn-binding protein ZnuA
MRPARLTARGIIVLAALVAGSACGTPEEQVADAPTPSPTPSSVLHLVSPVAPVADIVQQILGERGEASALVPPGADSHTYEPRPQDAVTLTEADAYIGIGLGLNDASVQLAEANLPEGAPIVLLG